MKVVFVGASKFSVRILTKLVSLEEVEIAGIITTKETFNISYSKDGVKNVLYAPLQRWENQGIDVFTMNRNPKDELLVNKIVGWNPDCFIVAGWYHMVPKIWRDIAPAYGLHASLLPEYSGGAPLVWALINGEDRTGITMFKMDKGVDSGPIVGQEIVNISSDETIATLYEKVEEAALILIAKYVPMLNNEEFILRKQDESKRTVWPQRNPDDGHIDCSMDVEYIDRFIRAQTKPYPGAFIKIGDAKLKIWKAERSKKSMAIEKNLLYCEGEELILGCLDGGITLKEISVENGSLVSEKDQIWINNIKIDRKGYS